MVISEGYYQKTFYRRVRCTQKRLSAELRDLLRAPDRFLNKPSCRIIQDNFKSKLGIVQVDGIDLVIKYHNFKDWLHRLRRYFRPTRASRNWYYSHLLLARGVWVPKPVACIETCIGPLRGESYFIYEYVSGMKGEDYFRVNRHDPVRAARGMELVVDLMRRIKDLRLIHGDVRVSNLIFRGDRVCLLDLDDIKPITWYQTKWVKNRDFRGLRKDIGYNIPPELKQLFLERIETL